MVSPARCAAQRSGEYRSATATAMPPVRVRQQQTKLLASQSGKDVVIANAVFDNIHDRQNHAVPHRMAPGVVNRS